MVPVASHNRRLMLNRFAVAGDSPTAAAKHNLQPHYAKRLILAVLRAGQAPGDARAIQPQSGQSHKARLLELA